MPIVMISIAHLLTVENVLSQRLYEDADQFAVFALDHAPGIPVLALDLRPDRLHVRHVLRLRCIDHHDAELAVSNALLGDIPFLDPEIADALICRDHRNLEIL